MEMTSTHNPIDQFNAWLELAKSTASIAEPTAMTLATATPDAVPSARIVLIKQCDEAGFLFYTNLTSRKSQELKANPHASLCFYWMPLEKQVRVEGRVMQASDAEADAYFASRTRARQVGAWASLQSQPLKNRAELDARTVEIDAKYAGRPVPRPPHWSGWRLVPHIIEFWQASDARLHERHIYTRDASGIWQHSLLYP
jgi:pyridoxamine 5'-phosphate oxidase